MLEKRELFQRAKFAPRYGYGQLTPRMESGHWDVKNSLVAGSSALAVIEHVIIGHRSSRDGFSLSIHDANLVYKNVFGERIEGHLKCAEGRDAGIIQYAGEKKVGR